MPIIRKVIKVGDSKGITIPKSWLEFVEKEAGQTCFEVAIEVNRILKIEPMFMKENKKPLGVSVNE